MHRTRNRFTLGLIALAAAALTLSGPARAQIFVIPYFDVNDPAATSWNISEAGAVTGYSFINSLSQAVGYTATVAGSGYSYNASTGGTGTLNNYGSGPNNNFIWGLSTNDSGDGSGALVGFDIDSTGSYNHDIYAKNSSTSQEVADDRGGNTTFLVGVAGDGTSAGFETISADGEAYFHAWGTKTGTPGATVDYPEPSGTIGSKAFEVSQGAGATGLGVKTFTGAERTVNGKVAFKAIVLKHAKTAKVSIVLSGNGPQVVTVTSSNTADLANFTATVPGGQNFVYNVKTPQVSKTAKGHVITLTASAPGGSQSVTVTIK